MKLMQQIKDYRKKKIERKYYKYFPERVSWVEPEKQIATMSVVKAKPESINVRKNVYIGLDGADPAIAKDIESMTKREIAVEIATLALEKKLIAFRNLHDPYSRFMLIDAKAEFLPTAFTWRDI